MKAEEIKKVLLIGSGTMCQQVAVQCALFGCEAVIYAINEKEKQRAVDEIPAVVLAPIVKAGFATQKQADETLKRISYISAPEQTPADINLVSESVPEDYATKQVAWGAFAPYLPAHAVLTTNTSTLAPSRYMEACGAPERFLAWHFHTPVFFQNMADVMPTPKTDAAYTQCMMEFSLRVGQNAVLLEKETPSYLANNMLVPVMRAALSLYVDGAASVEDIDRAWMAVRRADAGPFGIMDKIGLDVVRHTLGGGPEFDREYAVLDAMLEEGKLGAKSGEGFYHHPNPSYQSENFVTRPKPVP